MRWSRNYIIRVGTRKYTPRKRRYLKNPFREDLGYNGNRSQQEDFWSILQLKSGELNWPKFSNFCRPWANLWGVRSFGPIAILKSKEIANFTLKSSILGPAKSAELQCTGNETGPTQESIQNVFNKKSFRPTLNYSRPTSVNISFTIYAVLGVNEKSQILTTFLWLRMFWQHEFLTWIPDKCGGIEKISLPVEDIWTPDIIVYEFIDEDKAQRTPFVYVNHTGRIRYDRMLRVVSSCNLGIFNFPFDVQNCSLTFGSYMHTVKDVRLGLALPVEQILQNSLRYLETSGEWELLRIQGSPDILKFGIDEWDIIKFWVVIRRRSVLYVVNLLIPSAFLMLIDILSFYLPPHSIDRASFKMTLLLGYTVFLLIMNDLLPSTANGTPLIGIYFSVCLALLVLSLLETVIITHVLHRGTLQSGSVPAWVRRLVLVYIAQLICYRVTISSTDTAPTNSNITPATENDTPKCPPPSPYHGRVINTDHKDFLPMVPEILPPDALSPGPERQLALISQNLHYVREIIESKNQLQEQEEEWVQVGYVLDCLLYRLYLIFIGCYAIIIISVWCVWYNI
ncbi:5-hydroxytryptamine receptor 3A-like [Pelodytes ibericus]